eukprot:m.169274 g.169274  ORF g.169274 m.169274 type:complete len:825 (+) comp17802_c1_seq3:2413-4887(+)
MAPTKLKAGGGSVTMDEPGGSDGRSVMVTVTTSSPSSSTVSMLGAASSAASDVGGDARRSSSPSPHAQTAAVPIPTRTAGHGRRGHRRRSSSSECESLGGRSPSVIVEGEVLAKFTLGSEDDDDSDYSDSDERDGDRASGSPARRRSDSTGNTSGSDMERALSSSPIPFFSNVHTADRIGDYILGKTLGEGAFAKVKLATHCVTGSEVAVKVVMKHKIRDDYVRENLRREGQLMQRLRHTNIIRLYEVVETERAYCLVTGFASGGEVLDYIVAHGALSEKDTRRYVRQLISAVNHLHKAGIIHRDLKAENLLLDRNLDLKLIDFGLSNTLDGREFLMTQCGSPAYTAPELLGGKQYGPAVDIWSIGINMYAMLTGRLPFSSDNVTTLHALILDQKYTVPESFSPACKDLVARLLTVKVKDRITMDELRSHPWVMDEYGGPVPDDPGVEPVVEGALVESVLSQMVRMGYERQSIVDSVLSSVADKLHAMYYLLCERMCRTESPVSTKLLTRAASDGNFDSLLHAPTRDDDNTPEPEPSSPSPPRYSRRNSIEPRPRRRNSLPFRPPTAATDGTDTIAKPPRRRGSMRERRDSSFEEAGGGASTAVGGGGPRRSLRRASASVSRGLDEIARRARETSRRSSMSTTRSLQPSPEPKNCPWSGPARRPSASLSLPVSSSGSPTRDEAGSTLEQLGESPRRRTSRVPDVGSLPSLSKSTTIKAPRLEPISNERIKTLRFPFNRQMVSQKNPRVLFRELKTALQSKSAQMEVSAESSDLCFRCACQGVTFEAEIVKIPRLLLHGVHFRRVKGDTQTYRDLCTDVIAAMDL